MEQLINILIGSIATLLVGWLFARINKKALAKLIEKGLKYIVKDPKALNQIENETGYFFIEAGIEIIDATPDDDYVKHAIVKIKNQLPTLKEHIK